MRLGKPSFPIKFSAEQVTEEVKGLLEEQEWEEYEIQKPALCFFPYWVFNFNAFPETVDEQGAKTTTEGEQGTTAMNAQSSEIEDAIGESFNLFEDELVENPGTDSFKVIRFRIQKPEAERLAQLKIAARLNLDKEHVVVSGLRQVYMPVWFCKATFEEQEMEFRFDAVEGKLLSDDEVPYRGKSPSELAGETFSDLKNPLNWFRYLFDLIKGILEFLWNNPVSQWLRTQLRTNPRFQMAVLFLIVILIFMNEFGLIQFPTLPPIPFLNQG